MAIYRGEKLTIEIKGESHGTGIETVLEGLPRGVAIDTEKLSAFMERRAPGRSGLASQRRESDIPVFLSGVTEDLATGRERGERLTYFSADYPWLFLTGDHLHAIIRNHDARSEDYREYLTVPRPGHADYPAYVKYGHIPVGGGAFSGRMTAALCVAGGICLQFLEEKGVQIESHIEEIGGRRMDELPAGEDFDDLIERASAEGDSLGGIIGCCVSGLPVGMGGPMFDGMESRIAQLVFGIPAVKGVEFGAGFGAARLTGSENNDCYRIACDSAEGFDPKKDVALLSNNAGGLLGGMTNGQPLTLKVAIKPTPSIGKEQPTVDLATGENTTISVNGRHDPCIVPRALPCVEAAVAIAICDAIL